MSFMSLISAQSAEIKLTRKGGDVNSEKSFQYDSGKRFSQRSKHGYLLQIPN